MVNLVGNERFESIQRRVIQIIGEIIRADEAWPRSVQISSRAFSSVLLEKFFQFRIDLRMVVEFFLENGTRPQLNERVLIWIGQFE